MSTSHARSRILVGLAATAGAFGTALFDGIDEDSLIAPQNLLIGTVEALTNEPITGSRSSSSARPCRSDRLSGHA